MPAVEVNRVGMRALVQEIDADPIAFGRAQRRSRHLAVERPRREEHAGRDLDLAIDGDDARIPAAASRRAAGFRDSIGRVRAALRSEKFQARRKHRRVERVERDPADRARAVGGVRRTPRRRPPVDCACQARRRLQDKPERRAPAPVSCRSARRLSKDHLILPIELF